MTDSKLEACFDAIANHTRERLRELTPPVRAHFGRDYREASDPEARALREAGAHFHWLAFAFDPWPMWDLHVGVVGVEGHRLVSGIHLHERVGESVPSLLHDLASDMDMEYQYSEPASEHQFVDDEVQVDRFDPGAYSARVERISRRLHPRARTLWGRFGESTS